MRLHRISLILAAALILVSCQCQGPGRPTTDETAEPELEPGSAPALFLSMKEATVKPGQEVTVIVSVKTGGPLVEATYDLVWDGHVLKYVDSEPGSFFDPDRGSSFLAVPEQESDGRLHLVQGFGGSAGPPKGRGELSRIRLRAEAASGLQTGIMLDGVSLRSGGGTVSAADSDGMIITIQ